MKKLMVVVLLMTMLLLSGCEEAWEESNDNSTDEPSLHFMFIPKPDGGVNMIPIYY